MMGFGPPCGSLTANKKTEKTDNTAAAAPVKRGMGSAMGRVLALCMSMSMSMSKADGGISSQMFDSLARGFQKHAAMTSSLP